MMFPIKNSIVPYQNQVVNSNTGGFSLKEKIQYSLAGIIIAGGAFLIGKNLIKKALSKNEQSKTLDDGNAPTYAKQIKMAFHNDGWPGANVKALRQILRDIPNKSDFKKVMVSYQRLYNSSLLADMQGALKSTEYNELLYIVSAKPDNGTSNNTTLSQEQINDWAKRLKSAFDMTYGPIPGTDEEAIKAVFLEIPSQAVFNSVAVAYKALYGNDLTTDLKSELEFWEYNPMMQVILSKPQN